MKRLISILTWVIVGMNVMADDSATAVKLDSLSYAIGYQYTSMLLTDDNELMHRENDCEEYIRGLEENIIRTTMSNDSSYLVSYCAGGMEGVFITGGHIRKEDMSFFSFVVEGLRKVAEEKIILPADTIKAMAVLDRYSKEDGKPEDMEEKARREFFNAYGIMKAFQPGLQEYVNSLKLGTNILVNRQAYAKGMADVLEAFIIDKPKSAYELGRISSISANMLFLDKKVYSASSYIYGAKAALNIGELLIDKDLLEEIVNSNYETEEDSVVVYETDNDGKFEKLMNYVTQLDMGIDDISEKFVVDWDVTAQQIALDKSPNADLFGELLKNSNIEDKKYDGILMALTQDESGDIYKSISLAIKDMPLTKGYEWFCRLNEEKEVIVGIAESKNVFEAKAVEASVELELSQGYVTTQFTFDHEGADSFSKFTDENIAKHFVLKINGILACVPKIMAQITSGNCSATGLTPETVNCLFKGAKLKEIKSNAADEIEVIEKDDKDKNLIIPKW